MKKTFLLLCAFTICILFCSCSSNSSGETHFIHAMGFDKSNDSFSVTAICEKADQKDEKYLVITKNGKSIKEALDKINSEYDGCYFAATEFYFIPHSNDTEFLEILASELCNSNILPTKNSIICIDGTDIEAFMAKIETHDDIKKIKKQINASKTNTIAFLSKFMSEKKAELLCVELTKNNDIKAGEKVQFPRNEANH